MCKSEEFWDKSADNYDKAEERFEYIHRQTRENTKKHLRGTETVLDYGCGTGTTACEIANLVEQVHAIDISSRMIEIAKDKAAARKIENVYFARVDIFDDGYEEASFDVVLAFNMLHTVPDPHRVVQRAIELLKPGGLFISATPCLRGRMSFLVSLQIVIMRVLLKIGVIPVPIRRLRSSDLDDLLADKNIQIVTAEEVYAGASSYFVVAKKALSSDASTELQ
ncbi:MAG: class I SAM-dependent methyltransferase [Pseudomonadota bacterium]